MNLILILFFNKNIIRGLDRCIKSCGKSFNCEFILKNDLSMVFSFGFTRDLKRVIEKNKIFIQSGFGLIEIIDFQQT